MATSSKVLSREQLDLFDCPICMNFMYPPIYQCANGHTVCSDCRQKIGNCCPSCREEIGDIRALVLEKMMATFEFPCRYHENGCAESCKYDLKGIHESKCSHKPYNCPYVTFFNPCHHTGDAKALVTHLVDDHGCALKETEKIDISVPMKDIGGTYRPVIYKCYSEYFILHFVEANSTADSGLAYFSFMGEEEKARKFRYELKISIDDSWEASFKGSPTGIRNQMRQMYKGLLILLPIMRNRWQEKLRGSISQVTTNSHMMRA